MSIVSDNELALVSKTWSKLMQNPKDSGVTLFINLFKAHPHYKNLFRRLEKIPMENLAESKQMKAHGSIVMNALNGFIQNMDDSECLQELLFNNGVTHSRFGLTPIHYRNLWVVFINTCKDCFGPEFSEEEADVWRKIFTKMEKHILDGLAQEGVEDEE